MPRKEIYILRHGQTDYNLKGIVQGRGVDSSLNETGRLQASAFYDRYNNIPFDKIFISALQRTRQTVQQFIDLGIPTQSISALDEINWGIYEGVQRNLEMNDRYNNIISQWRNNELDIKIDGGESAQDLWDRQAPFINLLKEMEFQKVLVCSHGRSIRVLMCAITNTPLKDMDDFSHYNTCLYKVIMEHDKFSVELANNKDHLSDSLIQLNK